jgi:tetratricopeptide (TPR) repeat protein
LLLSSVNLVAQETRTEQNAEASVSQASTGFLGENPFKSDQSKKEDKTHKADEWSLDPSHAEDYAAEGWSLLSEREDREANSKALAYFVHSVMCDPLNTDARRGCGLAFMALHRYEEALGAFDYVLGKEPDRREIYPRRAFVRAMLAVPDDAERLKAAERDLEQSRDQGLDQAIARAARGILAAKRGAYQRATVEFTWSLEHGFDHIGVRLFRALCRSRLKDFSRAIAELEQLVKREPTMAEAFALLAVCHAGAGKPELALADYAHALQIDPADFEVVCDRLCVALALGKPEMSLDDLDRLVARHHDAPFALGIRGLIRWVAGKELALVKTDFDDAIKLCPKDCIFRALRAVVEFKQAHYAGALGDAGGFCLSLRRTKFEYRCYVESTDNGHRRWGVGVYWHSEGWVEDKKKDAKPTDLDHRFAELGLKALWALAKR